ncbi:Transaldolase [Gossypium arboreum]|uniref:Transaldolase n=1 Tax=Gossypium arboreum TaxID=29729 RepID=A0A0B0PR74_GOSAR|nr:Transaldolase [Gossypium arboreum]
MSKSEILSTAKDTIASAISPAGPEQIPQTDLVRFGVSCLMPEKERDRADDHTVEDGPVGEAVASGLETKIRI